ncbi:MAG: HAD family hydrolase [Dehalococcoidales bacterium]|nr:MAG: HAD family hydrolase [Dehalococcoidales bacterium]
MKYTAVIFDLFGTLIDNFSDEEYRKVLAEMASVLSAPSDDFENLWLGLFEERVTGVLESPVGAIGCVCQKLNVRPDNAQIENAARIRFDMSRRVMKLRQDAVKVLSHLKTEGYKTGLISDCSYETTVVWEDLPLAPLIDVAVFSCLVGIKKPDARIYHLATEQLEVRPEDCLYVGDGSSQELTGATRVGMSPVLIRIPDETWEDPYPNDVRDWSGPRVSSLTEVLALVK